MTKERIIKELEKIYTQIESLEEKVKKLKEKATILEEQKQQVEETEVYCLIRKFKISSERLQLLNDLNEEEILEFLEQKEKEKENSEKENSKKEIA